MTSILYAADILAERKRQLDVSGDPGHSGSGFWGFMPDCFCYNCRSYYDPSGQEMANYLNCRPSSFDRYSSRPSFLQTDMLWPRSLLASREERGGIFVELTKGDMRQEVTLEELVLKEPPLSVQVIGRNGAGQQIIVLYSAVEGGYKSFKQINGSHPSDSALWALEGRVIAPIDLGNAVATVFDT
jgi:hypothetical protein